jgi:transcriptional regulator with XRE-family HTH domain
MHIGEWIKTTREASGKSRGNLAAWCGVDTSTINRLENDRSDPTFATVVQICLGLNVPMNQLIGTFRPDADLEAYSKVDKAQLDFLSYSDLKTFEFMYKMAPLEACSILSDLMNQVIIQEPKSHEAFQQSEISINRACILPETVFIIVKSAPTMSLSVSYPLLQPNMLLDIYRQRAVFTANDLTAYITAMSTEKSVNLRQYFPPTLITNLQNGAIKNIKFKDILQLDQLVGTGEILAMAWYTFEQGWSYGLMPIRGESDESTSEEASPIYLLFRLCRQLQYLSSLKETPMSFLEQLRKRIQGYMANYKS